MENTLPYAYSHFLPSFSTWSWSLLSGINRSGWEKQGKLSSGAFCPRAVPSLEVICCMSSCHSLVGVINTISICNSSVLAPPSQTTTPPCTPLHSSHCLKAPRTPNLIICNWVLCRALGTNYLAICQCRNITISSKGRRDKAPGIQI